MIIAYTRVCVCVYVYIYIYIYIYMCIYNVCVCVLYKTSNENEDMNDGEGMARDIQGNLCCQRDLMRYIYIYKYIYIKLVTAGKGATPLPGLLHFTLDPYLIMLSVKQGDINYPFFFFYFFYYYYIWLNLGLNPGLLNHWQTLYSFDQWPSIGQKEPHIIWYIYERERERNEIQQTEIIKDNLEK